VIFKIEQSPTDRAGKDLPGVGPGDA